MKNSMKAFSVILIFASISFYACQQSVNGNNSKNGATKTNTKAVEPFKPNDTWNSYWYQGKAELTSYKLNQSRYGEMHEGTVVNIFVTEDFSKAKQVKLDDPSKAGDDKLPVLKLNQSIKFNTGIYPYSLMLSTFTPTDLNNYPHAVKITASIQEWCGMVYFQLNENKNKFDIEQRSYFEKEGDHDVSIDRVIQEDELWTMIRLDPERLPKGNVEMLPGALFLRLSHKPLESVKANLSLNEENGMMVYSIEMPSLNRKMNIRYEKAFPYKITGWDDSYPGLDGKVLTTTAVKINDMMLDYWRTHSNADRKLREDLGIPKDTQ